MKKFLTFFCAALCCGWLLSGCSEDSGTDTPSLEAISLNKHALSLEVGGQETLTVSVVPETIEGLVFEWSSSNTGVATVDGSGVVKAVAAGEAVVKVSCEGKSDECTGNGQHGDRVCNGNPLFGGAAGRRDDDADGGGTSGRCGCDGYVDLDEPGRGEG